LKHSPPKSSTALDLQVAVSRDASGKKPLAGAVDNAALSSDSVGRGAKGIAHLQGQTANVNAATSGRCFWVSVGRGIVSSLDVNSDGIFRRKSCRPPSDR